MPYFVVIRERSAGWDWARPMRAQDGWDVHAAFMDAMQAEGFLVAGGPLGDEDTAARVLHVIEADDVAAVEARLMSDPWDAPDLLRTVSIEAWTVLLGRLRR